jgi:hypothetical protein
MPALGRKGGGLPTTPLVDLHNPRPFLYPTNQHALAPIYIRSSQISLISTLIHTGIRESSSWFFLYQAVNCFFHVQSLELNFYLVVPCFMRSHKQKAFIRVLIPSFHIFLGSFELLAICGLHLESSRALCLVAQTHWSGWCMLDVSTVHL